MKKSVSILAGAAMSLMVVAGYAQDDESAAVMNPSSMNGSEELTSDLSSKLSADAAPASAPAPAPAPAPVFNVAVEEAELGYCKQSLDHLVALRVEMDDAEDGDQPGLELRMERALLAILKKCAALDASTVSVKNVETMFLFADQLSNNKYMGLTFAEERYLRQKAESLYSNVREYLSTQVVDVQLLEEDVERKQLSNSFKLKNLNDDKMKQCEDAWLNIQAVFVMLNKMQFPSVKEKRFDTINTQQFADAMQRNLNRMKPILKSEVLNNIKVLSDNCKKAADLGVEQAYLPTSLFMTFDAAKQNEKVRNAICNLDPNERVGPKYYYQQAVKARVSLGSGKPGEPNARLMLIPGKNWEYECPMDMSKFD